MKKRIKLNIKMIYVVIITLIITGCQNLDTPAFSEYEIDPSVVQIISPTEGAAIKVFEEPSSLDIEFKVDDDNLVSKVTIALDGTEIADFSDFSNPRHISETYTYEGLVIGDHTVVVTSTDVNGKSTVAETNFSKQAPYTSLFDGESLYMPFDGDYRDLIGFKIADQVGTPGFLGTGFASANAYKGAADSYIEFPADGLLSNEFSAAFWYKVDANPDRAGILVIGNDTPENRNQGFRLFREGSATEQRIKLNVGTGAAESWNDGGIIDVEAGQWVNIVVTVSDTQTKIYFNGVEVNSADLAAPIDWTGCDKISIGSGAPTFSYWDHKSDYSGIDELRLFNKALSQSDIQIMLNSFNPYTPQYAGESFYMPFDRGYIDLIAGRAASVVGSPEITDQSYKGDGAYLGATDSYLTYPAEGLLTDQFSTTFWYKVSGSPDRAGILVVGNDTPENRNQGFRLFREGSGTEQRVKLNIGTGGGESWNDGGVIDATAGEWVQVAVTVSDTQTKIYFDGIEVNSADLTAPIDWTGCDTFTIASGVPTFSYWNHLSDSSVIDELRFYNKALSPEEVIQIVGGSYTPPYFGATLYMPFDGTNVDKVTNTTATVVGTPGFAGESTVGADAYAGAADSYLTVPTDNLLGNQFSAAFWYKVNADPDRAGILTVGPPMNGADNDLSSGFRLFREGSAAEQRIKLHVGTDGGDVWNDGDVLDPAVGDWVHIAFTVSDTETKIYFNGVAVANTGDMTGKQVSWAGCDILSIGSGAPRFIAWGHLSDSSFIDDLHVFDRALTADEILQIMNK
ncbi:LamG-like jellyroll fold domain-containing protein [Yeosuana marina]|uniref:LamG-like jellyroll fold domain-containing protein n=1 Tax=Yeosuana marina TaxID=1565536 RepID=UPI0030ED3F8F|tara:strand:+ start:4721 stop:7105 length:2385 start_codon:yes stop_codon:yes gene_type:complete